MKFSIFNLAMNRQGACKKKKVKNAYLKNDFLHIQVHILVPYIFVKL